MTSHRKTEIQTRPYRGGPSWTRAGLAGSALLPFGLTDVAYAVGDHPAIGTHPALAPATP